MNPKIIRRHRQQGSSAVEFGIVAPLLLMLIMGIVDVGNLLFVYNSMLNAAREASRSVAVAEQTAAQAKTTAETTLAKHRGKSGAIPFTVVVTVPATPADKEIKTTISAPLSQALMLDMFGLMGSATMTAVSSMRQET